MNWSVLWMVAGITLLVAEMLTGTFVLVFLALGCLVSSVVSFLVADSLSLQLVTCALVSALGIWLLRRPLQRHILKATNLQADIGKEILIDQNIAPHQQTRISYQGTTWAATNLGAEDITLGDRVTIVGIDGNVLLIRKLD